MRSTKEEFGERLESVRGKPELRARHVGKQVALSRDLWNERERPIRIRNDDVIEDARGAPVSLQVSLDSEEPIEVVDNAATTAVQGEGFGHIRRISARVSVING